jgi:hypothetical protein
MRAIVLFISVLLCSVWFAALGSAQTKPPAAKPAIAKQTPSKTKGAPAAAVKPDSLPSAVKAEAAPDSTAKKKGKASSAEAKSDSAKAAEDPLSYSRPVFTYDPGGKRDPFNSLVPVENKDEKKIKGLFNYEKAALKGVVKSDPGSWALVLDGDGYAHVLKPNDTVFGGYVTNITADAVYLHIVKYGRSMTIILRMETARQTVEEREDGLDVMKRPGIDLSFEPGSISAGTLTSIEDVKVPSLGIQTVEEAWFGSDARGAGTSGRKGACTLISPLDNSMVIPPQVFRWTKAAGDSLYTLVFSEDRTFESQLVIHEGLTSSTCLLPAESGLVGGKRYYWKVMTLKKSGEWVQSRNRFSFIITESSDRGAENEKK